MPVDVAEDSLDLMIELLEAGPPIPGSYPYPYLRQSGKLERRTFRTVVLENPYLRATIVPDLGGRILKLEDKRTQTDVFPFSPTLPLEFESNRGVQSPAGLQILTEMGRPRLNSMGSVVVSPDFSGEDDEPSALWWGELSGNGLSLNCRYSMPPDATYLEVEVRVYNRTLGPVDYNGGLTFDSSAGAWDHLGPYCLWHGQAAQILVEPVDALLEHAVSAGGAHTRFHGMRYLAPRQLDSWRIRLYPFSKKPIRQANSLLAVSWDAKELAIQATQALPGCKVVVLTKDGATLELFADLYPEHANVIALDSLPSPIEELVILDPHRTELIRAEELADRKLRHRSRPPVPPIDSPQRGEPPHRLLEFTSDMGQRHLAHLLLAYHHLESRNFAQAAHSLEQSLLFNAEDHLAWWLKAIVERLAGEEGERPELLNAHFLAPLEPALRAESYLSSPSHTKEKAAVLNPLEETPEAFVEVACLLLEANLLEEAAKWIDEALRHTDLPMLRYLLAYAYLKGSRMEVQAAEQVQLAVRPEPQPPLPWRPIELEALRALAERFPADGSLKRMLEGVIMPV